MSEWDGTEDLIARECAHGPVAHGCVICELLAERDALQREVNDLRKTLRRVRGWTREVEGEILTVAPDPEVER